MGFAPFLLSLTLLLVWVSANPELRAIIQIKTDLDPENHYLSSWTINGDPCDGSFEGIACNENGLVANISLQGKGLAGKLSPAVAELKQLTGLYLHYNDLFGEIPKEIGNLTLLTDLYLNVNNLSGELPYELSNMQSLQVLQLCYNQFTGSIPRQLGFLTKLSVVALQANRLTGAIPAGLGDLELLTRLDLSFNQLFGSIPTKLADAPLLQVLDVRNNTLSGNVPPALQRLNDGFQYENNLRLCGVDFTTLEACNADDLVDQRKPEAYGPKSIPETGNVQVTCNETLCSNKSRSRQASAAIGMVIVSFALVVIGLLAFAQYRRRKQKLTNSFNVPDNRLTIDVQRKRGSPLISLEYASGWDPLADGRKLGVFTQETLQSFRFNVDEVETATQYFSEANLLGKSGFSATYRGILRDGSAVAVKSMAKSSCKSEESEFLKGLNGLTSLRHENLVRLRGFCCSRGRGECFLIYDYVPNGNLLQYLAVNDGEGLVLEWSSRVSIVKGIAKGISFLHGYKTNKPAVVHRNLSAKKILIDQRFSPLVAESGLHNLLTNDIVFSSLKATAAMGYLAPEYSYNGKFTDKSDVYAFGVLVFQILSGKQKVSSSMRVGAESCRFEEFVDPLLRGRFFEYEAAKLAKIALICTHESPTERPAMETVLHELGNFSSCL